MAKKWSDVAASAAFQSLTPEEQEEARLQYFDEIIAPQVPDDDLESVREMFDADTRSRAPESGHGAIRTKPVITTLDGDDEQQYRDWMRHIGHTRERGYNVDDNFTGQDYDYRGYFNKNGPVDL